MPYTPAKARAKAKVWLSKKEKKSLFSARHKLVAEIFRIPAVLLWDSPYSVEDPRVHSHPVIITHPVRAFD